MPQTVNAVFPAAYASGINNARRLWAVTYTTEGMIMRSTIFALLLLALAGINMACNTIHGFGQDVERAGEKTQDAADWVKKKL